MRRVRLAEGALLERFQAAPKPGLCFVCSLEVTRTLGYVNVAWSADSHSRIAHDSCWKLVLRYAQNVISSQQVER